MVTVRDTVGILAGLGHLDPTRAQNFHVLRLHAQHRNLVQPSRSQSVMSFHPHSPRSSVEPFLSMQRDPSIHQSVPVEESVILGADSVEVSRNQPTTASRLAKKFGKERHLLGTLKKRVPKRIEMNVDETIGYVWGEWGGNVHRKRTPPILAGEFEAGNATEHELLPSLDPILLLLRSQSEGKAFSGQLGHVCKGYSLKRRLVLGVRHPEGFAELRIAQDRDTDSGRGFLETDNVGTVGNIEYIAEK